MANEGLGRDPLVKKSFKTGDDWHPGDCIPK